jgi:hypothetical protein
LGDAPLKFGLLELPTPNFFLTSNGLNAKFVFFYPDDPVIPDDPPAA